jgi:hypothetical protein
MFQIKFVWLQIYKGSSKVSLLLYFWKKWKEQEGWRCMGIVGCHVTSRQGKSVDLAVSVRVAMKQWTWQKNLSTAPRRSNNLWYILCVQKVYPVVKFISTRVLSMGTILSSRVVYEWTEMFKNGRTSVTDAEHSGHPTTAPTAQNEDRARELIL